MAQAPDFPSRLLRGYANFRDQRLPQESSRYKVLAETGQRPRTMIVGCSDSRAAPETIFDAVWAAMSYLNSAQFPPVPVAMCHP